MIIRLDRIVASEIYEGVVLVGLRTPETRRV